MNASRGSEQTIHLDIGNILAIFKIKKEWSNGFMLDDLRLCLEKYNDEGSEKAYNKIESLLENIPIEKLYLYCFMIIKADALIEKKTESIISFLRKNDIHIVDYKFKHFFYDYEKESIYRYKLIDGVNDWYIRKKIFEIGPSIGLIVSYKGNDFDTIFEKIDSIKGTSNALTAPDGTIRKEFHGNNMIMNLIHSSDDPVATFREAELFFNCNEIEQSLTRTETEIESEVIHLAKYFAADMTTDFDVLCQRLIHQLFYIINSKLKYLSIDANYIDCNWETPSTTKVQIIKELDDMKKIFIEILKTNRIENTADIVHIGTAIDLISSTRRIFNNEFVNWEKLWRLYDENQIYFHEVQKIVIQGGFVCRNNK